jgi:hypothetical protein
MSRAATSMPSVGVSRPQCIAALEHLELADRRTTAAQRCARILTGGAAQWRTAAVFRVRGIYSSGSPIALTPTAERGARSRA